jgi:carbon monoxide dehydrogenase subunit G
VGGKEVRTTAARDEVAVRICVGPRACERVRKPIRERRDVMKLEHSFTAPVGVDEAWRVLLDIERIAPCMPGAALTSVDGDDFTGTVKVKVGPISLTYKGKASFVEKDEAAHRAVIDAQGKDARGNGTAAAKVAATLRPDGASTRVDVVTDLNVTGKPAQFGRGVMADVGNKLIGQFADCLAGQLASGGDAADGADDLAAADNPSASSAPREALATGGADNSQPAGTGPTPRAEADVEPIDLVASAGPAIAKRLAPIVAALVVVLLVLRRRRPS